MKNLNNVTFKTSSANGHFYSYAEWEYKNASYSFCLSTYNHSKGMVSGYSKRKNYASSSRFGTQHNLTEAQFLAKYEKHGAAQILEAMKKNMLQGHHATDTAPMPA